MTIDHIDTSERYQEEYNFFYDNNGLIDSLAISSSANGMISRQYAFQNDGSSLRPTSYSVTSTNDAANQGTLHFNLLYDGKQLKNAVTEEQASGYPKYNDSYKYDADNIFIFFDEPDDVSRDVPDSLIFKNGLLMFRSFFYTNSFYAIRTNFSYSSVPNPFYDKSLQAFAPLFMSKNFSFGSLGLGSVTGYIFDPISSKMVDHASYTQQYPGSVIGGTVTHAYALNSFGYPVTDETVQVLGYVPGQGPSGVAPDTLRANYTYEYITVAVNR